MYPILGFIPQLTVASIALLSLFTVGYFSKIGMHLLGLVDVSNLIYSFGLAFGMVVTVLMFVNDDTARLLRWAASDDDLLPYLVKGWNRAVIPLIFLGGVMHWLSFLPSFFASDVFLFTIFTLAFLWMMAIVVVRRERERVIQGSELSAAAIILIFMVFYAGRAQAHFEVFDSKNLYEFKLKDALLKDVRIVRSSSIGFIVASGGVVRFLPKDGVEMVTAEAPIDP